MVGRRYDTYYPSNTTVFTFNGPNWRWQKLTQSPDTGPGDSYNYSTTSYENFTFAFPVPAVAYYFYGIRETDLGFSQYAICSDCDPRTDSYHTFNTATVATYARKNEPVLLYSKWWSEPGAHKILVWNPPGTNGITVHHITIEVLAPEGPPKIYSAAEFAGALSASTLVGLLLGGLVIWLWKLDMKTMATAKDGEVELMPPKVTANKSKIPGEGAVAAVNGDLERGPSSKVGSGLGKANATSVATDTGYRGLPEPADCHGTRFDAGTPSRPVSYGAHERDQSTGRTVPGRCSATLALVGEHTGEAGVGISTELGCKDLPKSNGNRV